jgi:hypothetical protein
VSFSGAFAPHIYIRRDAPLRGFSNLRATHERMANADFDLRRSDEAGIARTAIYPAFPEVNRLYRRMLFKRNSVPETSVVRKFLRIQGTICQS